MEHEKPSQDSITLDPPPPHDAPKPCPKLPTKKKRGPMYFIKVALFIIRGRSNKSKGFSGSNSKSLWSKLVDSFRPLHLQLQQVEQPEANRQSPAHHTEFSEDSLFSPTAGSSWSASATPYSSAVGLNEMAQSEDETETETGAVAEQGDPAASGDWDGDKMIDAKAEEFIANFYNEIRLQRRHSLNERSLR